MLLRKQILPDLEAMSATDSILFVQRSHSGRGVRDPWARLGPRELGSAWRRMHPRAQLRVPISSQDGVCIRTFPSGTAPVAPQDGPCLLFLELLPVFTRDLHRMVLGHCGLGVLCPLEESHL